MISEKWGISKRSYWWELGNGSVCLTGFSGVFCNKSYVPLGFFCCPAFTIPGEGQAHASEVIHTKGRVKTCKNRRGPVVKTSCFYCEGYGFNPWSGNLRSHMPRGSAKIWVGRGGMEEKNTVGDLLPGREPFHFCPKLDFMFRPQVWP